MNTVVQIYYFTQDFVEVHSEINNPDYSITDTIKATLSANPKWSTVVYVTYSSSGPLLAKFNPRNLDDYNIVDRLDYPERIQAWINLTGITRYAPKKDI